MYNLREYLVVNLRQLERQHNLQNMQRSSKFLTAPEFKPKTQETNEYKKFSAKDLLVYTVNKLFKMKPALKNVCRDHLLLKITSCGSPRMYMAS